MGQTSKEYFEDWQRELDKDLRSWLRWRIESDEADLQQLEKTIQENERARKIRGS